MTQRPKYPIIRISREMKTMIDMIIAKVRLTTGERITASEVLERLIANDKFIQQFVVN